MEGSVNRIEQFSKAGPFQPRQTLEALVNDGSLVLDIGSGSGFWTLEAARLGARLVTAVERNPERVAFLAQKAIELGLARVRAVQGLAERLPADPESYDVVVASLVLHEVADLPGVIDEVRRVLRLGGTLVVVELQPEDNPRHPRIAVDVLRDQLGHQGFVVDAPDERGNWYCLVARKGRG